MTLAELIDVTERFLSNSGVRTDESKWDEPYIVNLINRYRGMAITQSFAANKNINPLWIQRYDLVYEEDAQEDACLVKFNMPSVMMLGNTQTGLIYFGNVNGICPFRFVKTRMELAMYNSHRYNNKTKTIRAIYVEGALEVRNDQMLQNAFIEGVFNIPSDLPTFNVNKDQYPISEDLIPLMHQLMYKNEGQFLSLKKPEIN